MTKPLTVDLEGRCALVTGGGTGIGRAISMGLARCGARVVVNYSRSSKEARATVDEIVEQGGQAVTIRADVTDENQVEQVVEEAIATYGSLDILMANAGGPTEQCPTTALSSEDWDAGLNLNCKSVFFCVKHAAPLLPDHHGRILITSSISARSGGGPGTITYTAAKGALNNLVRGWAKEFAPSRHHRQRHRTGCHLDAHPPAADSSGDLPGPDRSNSAGPGWAAGGLRGGGAVPGEPGSFLHHRTNHRSQRRDADAVMRAARQKIYPRRGTKDDEGPRRGWRRLKRDPPKVGKGLTRNPQTREW